MRTASWTRSKYHGANAEVSTCFALLFLSRANVAKDLTTILKGQFTDPAPKEPAPKQQPLPMAPATDFPENDATRASAQAAGKCPRLE